MTMHLKLFIIVLISALLSAGMGSCSKEEINPDDYATSILSGEYSKSGLWKLNVSLDGVQLENYGSVKFSSKMMDKGDFTFINVIPGVGSKEFKDIPLAESESGYGFIINYTDKNNNFRISGFVNFGEMSVFIESVS